MPMYEYKCSECGQKFEELVFNGTQVIVCPGCKSENVQKQISVFAASVPSSSGSGSCGGGGCGSGFS